MPWEQLKKRQKDKKKKKSGSVSIGLNTGHSVFRLRHNTTLRCDSLRGYRCLLPLTMTHVPLTQATSSSVCPLGCTVTGAEPLLSPQHPHSQHSAWPSANPSRYQPDDREVGLGATESRSETTELRSLRVDNRRGRRPRPTSLLPGSAQGRVAGEEAGQLRTHGSSSDPSAAVADRLQTPGCSSTPVPTAV